MNEPTTLDTAAVDALVGQIADEFTQRLNRGEQPAISEYVQRHPAIGGVLREVLAALQMVRVVSPELAAATDAEPAPPVPGYLGDFRILREIGRGGMGVVYEAEQISLARPVALKILPFAATLDPKQLLRFKNEVQAAAHLHHQNIVPVYAVGCERGVHYYAMQFVPGKTVASVIDELRAQGSSQRPSTACNTTAPTLPLEQGSRRRPANPSLFRTVAGFGVQAALALEHAHQLGVIHRDVKPANLLVDSHGHLWVTDFGLARLQGDSGLTTTGDLIGTLRYMSPEQALARHTQVDHRTDIYSLGATLYELLTLEPAVPGSERHELLRQIAEEEPRRPRRHNPAIPEDLQTIVLKAMAKSPAERYATAQELADDLQRYLDDTPIRARPPSWLQLGRRWARRHRPVVVAAAVAVLAVLLVSIGLLALSNAQIREEERRTARERDKALQAEDERTEQLRQSLLTQAQARRLRRQQGQRFAALAALSKAAEIAQSLDQADPALLQLRNEAIACLALVDLQEQRALPAEPANEYWQAFDQDFKHYAWIDRGGTITIAAVAGTDPPVRLRGPEQPPRLFWMQFSPDGRWLAARYQIAGRPCLLHIWDIGKQHRVEVILRGQGASGVAFSADSRTLATSRSDGTIGLYDPATGTEVRSLGANLGDDLELAFAPHEPLLAISTGSKREALIFDAASGNQLATLEHPSRVNWVCWADGGRLLAVGCDDQRIHVWNPSTRQRQTVLNGHWNKGIGIYSPASARFLATRSWDGTTRLWDPIDGRMLVSARGHLVALRGDGQELAMWRDGRLVLFTVADGRECRMLHHGRIGTHTARPADWGPRGVDFSSDGRLLASASVDGVRLWEATGGRELAYLPLGHSYAARFVAGDTPALITCSNSALLHWPTRAEAAPATLQLGPPRTLLSVGQPAPWTIGLSHDAHWLAFGAPYQAHAILLNLDRFAEHRRLEPNTRITRVAVSPNGQWVAIAGWGAPGSIQVWEAASGKRVWQLPAAEGRPRVAFSPDGKWLVTSASEPVVRFWYVGSWSAGPVAYLSESSDEEMVFSSDGKLLALTDSLRGVKLVEAATGRELASLEAPEDNAITSLTFSPDGCLLAAPSTNHTIHLWDLRALRRQLRTLRLDWDLPAPHSEPAVGVVPAALPQLVVLPGEYGTSAFVSLGLYEAESLSVVDQRDSYAKEQPMAFWTRADRHWSNGSQLLCNCLREGAFIELEVSVPATAEYQLDVYFTQAPDYGKVQVATDGKPVGSVFDGFDREVAPAGKTAVGTVNLRRGAHRLRFTSVGKHPQSTGLHMGIDCLELVPVR